MRYVFMISPLLLACSIACDAPEEPSDSQGSTVELVEPIMNPVDATPSQDGVDIFVVTDSSTQSQLLELSSGEVTTLVDFQHARAVVIDSGTYGSIYVADTGMDAVFEYQPATDELSMVPGTDGLGARALHFGDAIYIAGDAGLYSIPPGGAAMADMIATGFPGFIDGVTQADDGTLYVTGEAAPGSGVEDGALFEIVDGVPTVLADGIHLGSPAGVAITPDEATVMVSSLSGSGTSQVLLVSREDGSTSVFDDVIRENDYSGGLHRAANDPAVFAWAGHGVYRVEL